MDQQFNNSDGPISAMSRSLTLSTRDAAAVDAVLEDGHPSTEGPSRTGMPDEPTARGAPASGQDRRQAVAALFALLDMAGQPDAPTDLKARTLAKVARERALPRGTWRQEEPIIRTRFINQRVLEFATMAAAAALLLAVLIPGLYRARENVLRVGCADNLRAVGEGMAQYASDDLAALPRIHRPADRDWLPRADAVALRRSADAHSNTANLRPLSRGTGRARYVRFARLICPGQAVERDIDTPPRHFESDVVGYSYLNQFGPFDHHWRGGGTEIVLADRNPLFAGHECQNPMAGSPNHGGSGQNVLSADGAVAWTRTPNVGPDGDNIWTIGHPYEVRYTGTEVSDSRRDIILSP